MRTDEHGPIKGPNLPTQGPVNATTAPNDANKHNEALSDGQKGTTEQGAPTDASNGSAEQRSSDAPAATCAAPQEGETTLDDEDAGAPGAASTVTNGGAAEGGRISRWRRRFRLKPSWLEMDQVLKLATPAAKWPDYAKVDNVNALIAGLWPYISDAAEALVKEQLAPWARDFVQQQGRGILVGLSFDVLDFGTNPMWLEAVKTYDTEEDELIFEGPLAWASTMKARVSAELKLLGMTFKLPLDIRNLQMRVHARLTARPITETAPFIGSVTITLLEKPHLDFELLLLLPRALLNPLHNWHGFGGERHTDSAGNGSFDTQQGQSTEEQSGGQGMAAQIEEAFTLDLMALPLVRGTFQLAARLAARALLMFPKGYTMELAPGGAQRPWPGGMLELRLIKITGLRSEDLLGMSDPYCILQVREGRMSRTRTISNDNDPEFDEQFTMLVDSTDRQVLRLVVKDEDWGPKDKILGVAELPLKQAPFLLCPGMHVPFTMTLRKVRSPRSPGLLTAPLNFLLGVPINAALAGTETVSKAIRGSRRSASSSSASSSSDSDDDTRRSTDQNSSSSASPGPGSGSASSRMHLPGREARRAERAKGEQHAALARLRDGAQRAVRAGHRDDEEVEVVAEYMRQAQQLQRQLQREEEQEQQQGRTHQQHRSPHGTHDTHRTAQQDEQQPRQQGAANTRQPQQQQQQQHGGSCSCAHVADSAHGSSSAEGMTALVERQMQEEGAVEAGRSKLRRGQVQDQLKAETRGTVFLEAVWTPFKRPAVLGGGGGPGFGSGLGPPIAYQRAQRHGKVHANDVGILTVTLLRANNLSGWRGGPDPYVKFSLHDKVLHKRQTHISSVVYNEPHPRFNEKFDFVMISAGSVLVVTVMDKTRPTERLVSLKVKGRFQDQQIGHVRVPVQRVAEAGRIKHEWPLLGAEQGAIELALEWFPASVCQA